MGNVKKWFINLSIQRKFLYCALGITLTVLMSTSISLYLAASRIVLEQSRKQSAGVIKELSVNLDHYFEIVEHSFDYIANNSTVQEELKSDTPYYSDGMNYVSYFSREGQIRRLLLQGYTSVYMNDIQLHGYNGAQHLLSNGTKAALEGTEEVFRKAEEANGRCVYYNAADEAGLIYIAKQIKDSLTMEPLGILQASIKVSYLERMTEAARNSLTAEILLWDDEQYLILQSLDKSPEGLAGYLSGNDGSFQRKMDGQTYNCVYQKSSDTGFTLVGMVPMSFLQKTARELQKTVMILLGGSILLCVVLATVFAKGIAGPIERTSKAMKQFAGGDFTVRLPEGRTDEIGAMNSVFNHTIEEVEHLLKKVVEMEMLNKDIEFQNLQAQMNPHFLYNVLDTINWMARKKGEDNICHMVTAISNLLRASISNKKSMVSIREEMKYVQDYLYIQETRYGDKLVSDLEIEESLNDVQIPKMSIQTLVENAVVHGVENATWNCFLSVTGIYENDRVRLTVYDTGVGISENKVKTLLKPLDERSEEQEGKGRLHTRLGIYAIRKRLEYVYGGEAEMTIRSKEGKGTEVTLTIPLQEIRRVKFDEITGNDIRR